MFLVSLNYVEVVNGQTCMTDLILHLRQHCSTKWRNSAYGGFPAMRRYKKRERKREAGGNSLPSGSASSWRRSVPDPPHPPKHSSRRSMDLSRQERKELSWWLNLFRTTLSTKKHKKTLDSERRQRNNSDFDDILSDVSKRKNETCCVN